MEERRVLQNAGAHERGASRDHEDTAIDHVGRADLEIVSLQIQTLDHVQDPSLQVVMARTNNSLVGSNDTDFGIHVESGEGELQERVRPHDVVVHENHDSRRHSADTESDLGPLVGPVRGNDNDFNASNLLRVIETNCFHHRDCLELEHSASGHDNDPRGKVVHGTE